MLRVGELGTNPWLGGEPAGAEEAWVPRGQESRGHFLSAGGRHPFHQINQPPATGNSSQARDRVPPDPLGRQIMPLPGQS